MWKESASLCQTCRMLLPTSRSRTFLFWCPVPLRPEENLSIWASNLSSFYPSSPETGCSTFAPWQKTRSSTCPTSSSGSADGCKADFALDLAPWRRDDSYPEYVDQDKNDDSIKGSDTDRSSSESDRDEFGHCDDSEHDDAEKLGLRVQLDDMPGRSRKKNMKELTPLQATLL